MTLSRGQGRCDLVLVTLTLTLVLVLLLDLSPATSGCILLLNGWTPKSIGDRTVLADIVITGDIRRAFKEERTPDNTYTSEVSIVRVLKGQDLLEEMSANYGNNEDRRGSHHMHRVFNISNFGDKIMCYADVDEGVTYILFVTTYDGRLSAKYDDIFGAAAPYSDDAENEALEAQGKAYITYKYIFIRLNQ